MPSTPGERAQVAGSAWLSHAIPPTQQASRNPALMQGKGELVFPRSTLANSVLEKLQSSYRLHMHCSVAEICLLWSLGCSNLLLLIHCLREALKREGKLCGEAPVVDSAGMVMAVALRGMARVSSCLLNKYGGKSGEFKSDSSCRAGFLREAAATELPCPSD